MTGLDWIHLFCYCLFVPMWNYLFLKKDPLLHRKLHAMEAAIVIWCEENETKFKEK